MQAGPRGRDACTPPQLSGGLDQRWRKRRGPARTRGHRFGRRSGGGALDGHGDSERLGGRGSRARRDGGDFAAVTPFTAHDRGDAASSRWTPGTPSPRARVRTCATRRASASRCGGCSAPVCGDLTLELDEGERWTTDTAMEMAAAGVRGVLVPARETGGFELAARSDAQLVRMRSDAATGSTAISARRTPTRPACG